MDRRASIIAVAVLAGLLLVGVVWGLIVSALTLIGVILLAGLLTPAPGRPPGASPRDRTSALARRLTRMFSAHLIGC